MSVTTDRCSTPCDPDCDAVCHADHVAGHKKDHWPYDCPAADRYGWGGSDFIAAAVKRLKAERDQARIERDAAVLANRSLADTNRDLANENADLNTTLADLHERIGEEDVEWRAEQPSGAWNMSYTFPVESIARQVVELVRGMGFAVKLRRRVVGQWKDVES